MIKTFTVNVPKTTETEVLNGLEIHLSGNYAGKNFSFPLDIADTTLHPVKVLDTATATPTPAVMTKIMIGTALYDMIQDFVENGLINIKPNLTTNAGKQILSFISTQRVRSLVSGVVTYDDVDVPVDIIEVIIVIGRLAFTNINFQFTKGNPLPQTVIDEALAKGVVLSNDVDNNIIIDTPFDYSVKLRKVDAFFVDTNGFKCGLIKIVK